MFTGEKSVALVPHSPINFWIFRKTLKKLAFATVLLLAPEQLLLKIRAGVRAGVRAGICFRKKGLNMKSVVYSMVVAASLATTSAFAADMAVKAPPAAPPPSPWDLVITAALMNDYNFRGITQSNHRPSTQSGFELRYNWNPNVQSYIGLSGESIDFPNNAAAEIDLYGGIRPTFGKLATDFGVWEYYYPDGKCFNTAALCGNTPVGGLFVPSTQTNPLGGNGVVYNESFVEIYGKGTYTVNDNFNFGGSIWYSPDVLNTGAWGVFYAGNVTLTAPTTWFQNGIGAYASADVGYWDLGTSNSFYAVPAFPAGVPYTSYLTWDLGVGFTWKVLTLDLRYYDSDLTKAECNVFTSAQNATFAPGNVTAQNPTGLGSNWCGAAFVAKLSASIDLASNIK
jgi:uncharacterized protein (TIGR02001 family)